MNNITEIIPDDFPDWAKDAFRDGQFFRIAVGKVADLTEKLEEALDNAPTKQQVRDEFESDAITAWRVRADIDKETIKELQVALALQAADAERLRWELDECNGVIR